MLEKLKPIASFIHEVWQEFSRDRGSLFAAAISFFGVISLIPLILLAVGIFGYVVGSRENALREVLGFVKNFIPVGSDLLERYLMYLSRHSKFLSGIGLVGLLWAGMQVFVILQQVINVALGAPKQSGFLRTRGIAIVLVLVAGALFLLSITITSLLTAARHQPDIFGIGAGYLRFVWSIVGVIVPVIISILAFTFIYKSTPVKDVGNASPMVGGVTAGVLFEIAKHAFRWYVTSVANFKLIYGPLGSAVVLILWIYYVSLIAVIGAEVTSVYARRIGMAKNHRRS